MHSFLIGIVNCQSGRNSLWVRKKFFLFENEKRKGDSVSSKRKNIPDCIIIALHQRLLKVLSTKKLLFISPIEGQQIKIRFINKQIQ